VRARVIIIINERDFYLSFFSHRVHHVYDGDSIYIYYICIRSASIIIIHNIIYYNVYILYSCIYFIYMCVLYAVKIVQRHTRTLHPPSRVHQKHTPPDRFLSRRLFIYIYICTSADRARYACTCIYYTRTISRV